MEPRAAAIGPGQVKAVAARYLSLGSLAAMAGAILVAGGCDRLLFQIHPAAGLVVASAVFILALFFCCWLICVSAFKHRRLLLRVAIHLAQRRFGGRQVRRAPALAGARLLDADGLSRRP